jgi:ElaB/YqjD/DUF883 family membrane-anchored ribosome-binding protein
MIRVRGRKFTHAGEVLQRKLRFGRQHSNAALPKVNTSPAPLAVFSTNAREEAAMNSETSDIKSMNGISSAGATTGLGGNGSANVVHRVAQKAHETVDRLEQTVATGSEKVMTMQEEYGSYAREQIKAHPLSTVAGAFALGLLLGKILR